MNEKAPPPSWGQAANRDAKAPQEKSTSSDSSSISDRAVLMPRAAPDNYLERVAAASGKPKPVGGGSGEAPQKMTSDNYQEIYRKEQAALQKSLQKGAENATEEQRKAEDAKRLADVATREKHLSSQIDAWQRTLGHDADTDMRTRATITTLSRELANLRKK